MCGFFLVCHVKCWLCRLNAALALATFGSNGDNQYFSRYLMQVKDSLPKASYDVYRK